MGKASLFISIVVFHAAAGRTPALAGNHCEQKCRERKQDENFYDLFHGFNF
jgi:hypothetical protein